MKKTILAMAVPALLAAGAAQASVNLYDGDGVSVDLSGAAEIQYYKGYSKTEDSYLRIDDADLILKTAIEVSDSLDAVAGMGFKYENNFNNGVANATGNVDNDELWVGFASADFGTITFGRQILIIDDAGNQKDYELGTEQTNFVQYEGAQVIKWRFDNGAFYAGAEIDLDSDKTKGVDGTQVIDGVIGGRFESVDARVYFYDGENLSEDIQSASYVVDAQGYNFELDYAINDAFDVALAYGQIEYKDKAAASTRQMDVDVFGISGGYQADEKTSFAVGYDWIDGKGKGGFANQESTSLYANVTYKLQSNAKVYAEVGVADKEIGGVDQDTDTGYVLGMEVKF
ncbi:porin [Enterovibrio norvegicus FF-162]|uniref:Porin n=1 Tax=Enterovibrio norvegicus FF-454 TaxID=1185651 RepID=A0A1E5C102_9GAMM|nr:porin [Enterovibrio norvegicus]OEE58822.1 porin [Enterovibrio norvegicus FF-454]OEE74158.1 porin [Enterovibrio norvegicus FF-162]